ncbi:MAG: hypothetical protein RL722_526 [Pseudomonadota bacterium]|jgi:hypothetical protein
MSPTPAHPPAPEVEAVEILRRELLAAAAMAERIAATLAPFGAEVALSPATMAQLAREAERLARRSANELRRTANAAASALAEHRAAAAVVKAAAEVAP